MSSKHLVDPELVGVLDFFPKMLFEKESMTAIRNELEAMYAAMPVPENPFVIAETVRMPAQPELPAFDLRVYRHKDAGKNVPAILHFHGGGYVIGSPGICEIANRTLVAELGCAIVSVNYPLAPEHPHPQPVEAAYAALKWLNESAGGLGVDKTRIGVKGESAGGGLAACLALLARDRGEFSLAFQHLIQPMLDDRTGSEHPFAGEFVWTAAQNRFAWSALLGSATGKSNVSEYAAPARATNLRGLPPTFIAVGALDLFLHEDADYAQKLAEAGVPVELHVYPGAYHGFDLLMDTRVAQQAGRDSLAALRAFMRLPSAT